MPDYRRYLVPGGSYFFTLATHERQPLFDDARNVERLRTAARAVQAEWPFEFVAAVILLDHVHFIWTLPPGDDGFSRRIGRMKANYKPHSQSGAGSSFSRAKHRERTIWQRRFWEHSIRDEDDFKNHLDYIHYNPVKHGLATCPHAWPHSSFAVWVARGEYDLQWGCSCDGRTPSKIDSRAIEGAAGEP